MECCVGVLLGFPSSDLFRVVSTVLYEAQWGGRLTSYRTEPGGLSSLNALYFLGAGQIGRVVESLTCHDRRIVEEEASLSQWIIVFDVHWEVTGNA